MRPLELDYLDEGKRLWRVRYALAAVALVFAADTAWYYRELQRGLAHAEGRIAHAKAVPHDGQSTPQMRQIPAEEYSFARDTASRITTPWAQLFQALEAAQTDRIALLAIEPDAEQRSVSISGEAGDYLAALSYLASLSEQKALARVHLVKHELQQGGRTHFAISASWKDIR